MKILQPVLHATSVKGIEKDPRGTSKIRISPLVNSLVGRYVQRNLIRLWRKIKVNCQNAGTTYFYPAERSLMSPLVGIKRAS